MSRATVIGLGVIGASVAAALKRQGWHVSGSDTDAPHAAEALARGFIDEVVDFVDADCEIVFVAVPALSAVRLIERALEICEGIVTDVTSVKQHLCGLVVDPRFVPGHPMAGSERHRLDGASAVLFENASWLFTPTATTDDGALERVMTLVSGFGARPRILSPLEHDSLMASVSHCPHFVAATLVNFAFSDPENRELVASIAGRGFRDMTRVASGDSAMWIDIAALNAPAIENGLRDLAARLVALANTLANRDFAVLSRVVDAELAEARQSRENLSVGPERTTELVMHGGEDLTEMVAGMLDLLGLTAIESFESSGELHVLLAESGARSLWGALLGAGVDVHIRA